MKLGTNETFSNLVPIFSFRSACIMIHMMYYSTYFSFCQVILRSGSLKTWRESISGAETWSVFSQYCAEVVGILGPTTDFLLCSPSFLQPVIFEAMQHCCGAAHSMSLLLLPPLADVSSERLCSCHSVQKSHVFHGVVSTLWWKLPHFSGHLW